MRLSPTLAQNQGLRCLPSNLSLLLHETKSLGFQLDKEEPTCIYLVSSSKPHWSHKATAIKA